MIENKVTPEEFQTKEQFISTNNYKKGFFLRYSDFKKIEEIIEGYHTDNDGELDFDSIPNDEKEILWKIKTIIRNIELSKLRPREERK